MSWLLGSNKTSSTEDFQIHIRSQLARVPTLSTPVAYSQTSNTLVDSPRPKRKRVNESDGSTDAEVGDAQLPKRRCTITDMPIKDDDGDMDSGSDQSIDDARSSGKYNLLKQHRYQKH
jgi:hypothetical protein